MVAESAIATAIMSRPSSLFPIVHVFTRGDAESSANM